MKPLKIAEEFPEKDESYHALKIADTFKKTLLKYYGSNTINRMFHPKMHGLVLAEFSINKNLPPKCKKGIFKEGKSYAAWIRFSNAKRHPSPDWKKDMRGMAIKLVGIGEKKLLLGKEDAVTHDFLLVSAETLQTSSVKEFSKAITALTGGFFKLLLFAITRPRVIIRSIKQLSKCSDLLEMQYFSMTPYKLGHGNAVKYSAVPRRNNTATRPDKSNENYLTARLSKALKQEDQYFDFMVQFQEDPKRMPIENPTVKWDSSYIKVATIKIHRQQFNSEKQREYGKSLSFSPWHCIEDHKPLGGANRARKIVYTKLANFRRGRNHIEDQSEPESIMNFNN